MVGSAPPFRVSRQACEPQTLRLGRFRFRPSGSAVTSRSLAQGGSAGVVPLLWAGGNELALYGTMYGMVKTTVYLPEVIREAIRALVGDNAPARPRVPLIGTPLGDPTAAERVDDLLDGFGAP